MSNKKPSIWPGVGETCLLSLRKCVVKDLPPLKGKFAQIINLKFVFGFQRTHPTVNMSGGGGYLLTGIFVQK